MAENSIPTSRKIEPIRTKPNQEADELKALADMLNMATTGDFELVEHTLQTYTSMMFERALVVHRAIQAWDSSQLESTS